MPSHFWETFQRFSIWSLEFLTLPPVTIVAIACWTSLVSACVWQRPLSKGKWHPSYWLILTQLLYFPVTVTIGVWFPASGAGPHRELNVVGQRALDATFYLSLMTACFWVYRLKGLRWFAASAIACQQLLILGAGFIAGMSVTGDWL